MTAIVSSLIGNLAILFETKSRRKEITLFQAPKSIEAVYNQLLRRHWIPRIPHLEKIIFIIGIGLLALACTIDKEEDDINLKPSFIKIILTYLWK